MAPAPTDFDPPPLGYQGQHWYARRLAARADDWLRHLKLTDAKLRDSLLTRLADVEPPFVVWHEGNTFVPEIESASWLGAAYYRFDEKRLDAEIRSHVEAVRTSSPDLDTALERVHRGAYTIEELQAVPHEPYAVTLLQGSPAGLERHRANAAAWDHRQSWPRLCRTCGEEFAPDRRGTVNCDVCRATGASRPRSPRSAPRACASCGEVFTPRQWNMKRCDGCRAGTVEAVPQSKPSESRQ